MPTSTSKTFLFVVLLATHFANAQPVERVMEVPKSAADCMGAIKLVDGIGPLKNIVGAGFYYEIENKYGEYPFLMTREFNPCWFKFSTDTDGELEMMIKSVNPEDNYNFALYLSPGPWFCKTFPSEHISVPMRANCSYSDQGLGQTGINPTGTDSLATAESASAFCLPLKVTRGEAYYLVVDSETRPQSGYTIEIRVKETANE